MIAFGELERPGEEAVVAYFEVPSRHSPGGTEKNHRKPQSGQLLSRSKFEPGT
jgi:hypothetical protein